jgi:hypothetical protein
LGNLEYIYKCPRKNSIAQHDRLMPKIHINIKDYENSTYINDYIVKK